MLFTLPLLAALGSVALGVSQPTAADTQDPPPSVHAILEAARRASGPAPWRQGTVLLAEGQIEASGLKGSWSRIEDLGTGRWVSATRLGVSDSEEGQDQVSPWRQGPSGTTHRLNSTFSHAVMVTDAWLTQRGWLHANALGALVVAKGRRPDAERTFDVVDATPKGGQQVEMWFDSRTHRLARTVRQMPISTQTVELGDYRETGGRWLPHRIESRESGSSNVTRITVAQWTTRPHVDDARFAPPPAPNDTTLAGSTTVPMEVDGFITITATLNGQAMDFIVDTGGHNILTPAAAKLLDVHPVGAGASGGAGEGETAEQYVRIDRMDIGAATLRDQHFYVLDFDYNTVERGTRPPLAGLLGLELFERFATRIDYRAKTFTLTRSANYRYHGPGVAVPITFDDDMPLIEGRINGLPGLMALDTGNSGTTVIQQVWARQNGLAEQLQAGLSTVSFGAGGESRNFANRIDSIELGGARIARPIARYATDKAGSFTSRTEAANIGTDILGHFALEFDYARNTIWFEPQPGWTPPPYNRAGLRLVKTGLSQCKVAMVTPNSPADALGLVRGDEILAVDGAGIDTLSGRDLGRKLTQAPGQQVRLSVRHADEVSEKVLTLADILP